jgi:hypothetical protein
MKTLIDVIDGFNVYGRYVNIPHRIFLDTNVLQYLMDFGTYIFEHEREYDDKFVARKIDIKVGDKLYYEILALHDIFLAIEYSIYQFALSESVYKEVIQKGDNYFNQWFFDVWSHWESVLNDYSGIELFSKESEVRYKKALTDKSLLGSYSFKDQAILLDAIRFDCDTLLTVDKFSRDQYKRIYVFDNYNLKILTPTDFMKLIESFPIH